MFLGCFADEPAVCCRERLQRGDLYPDRHQYTHTRGLVLLVVVNWDVLVWGERKKGPTKVR